MELTDEQTAAKWLLDMSDSFAEWAESIDLPLRPGHVLHALIRNTGFVSLSGFGQAAGISSPTLTQLIAGQRRITAEMAVRIAQTLNVSPMAILQLQDEFDLHGAYYRRIDDRSTADTH